MIEPVKLAGKYLDQPLLVSKFKQAVPKIFIGGAATYGLNEVRKAPNDKKRECAINNTAILGATVASALAAPRIASKIVRKPYERFLAKDIINNTLTLQDEIGNLEIETLLSGKYDLNNAIVTIHPGARRNRITRLGRNAI